MENIKTGWEVTKASVSQRNGGLYVQGINHETTDPLFKTFGWHIQYESLKDGRFDFSGCMFEGNAQEVHQRLLAKAQS
jgi:hypothetical protein